MMQIHIKKGMDCSSPRVEFSDCSMSGPAEYPEMVTTDTREQWKK